MLVNTVLKGQLAESSNGVLDDGVLAAPVLATELIEPLDAVHQVVDDGDDDGDTDGVAPDDNNGDNIDPAITTLLEGGRGIGDLGFSGQPAEDTEDGSEDIDTEDGGDELEGRPGLSTTGDEDEPVLSEGNLEEEDFLHGAEVLDDTTVGKEEGTADDPCAKSEEYTEDDRDDPDLGKLPFDWAFLRVGVIVSDSDGSQISEQGEKDDELDADRLTKDDHGGDQVDLQVKTQSDAVLDIRLHALEDLTGSLDGQDNGGKTRSKEDNIGSGLCGLRGTFDSNTAIGLLQRGSIVDT